MMSACDTSKATAASRLRSITALYDGSSPLKRAQQHKARMLSCASLGVVDLAHRAAHP